MPERSKLGGLRGVALIVIGIFMGATLITPAVAHVGGTLSHLWSAPNHIRDKVRVYGDNRWLGKTAKATDSAHADEADHAATAESATNADNADLLNNRTPADFDDAVTLAGRSAADFDDAVTLNGRAANSLVRAARMSTSNTTEISTTEVTYGSALSITAPSAGFVVVNANTTIQNVGCTSNCYAYVRVRHIQTGSYTTLSYSDSQGAGYDSAGNSWVFPVSAGANTFDIRIYRGTSTSGTLNGWYAEMNAIFVPFGATGGISITAAGASVQKAR
jgi:hypothetical protein